MKEGRSRLCGPLINHLSSRIGAWEEKRRKTIGGLLKGKT